MFRVERIPVRIDRPLFFPIIRENCQHLLEVKFGMCCKAHTFLLFRQKIKSGGTLMKKILASILTLTLGLGLTAGCGSQSAAAPAESNSADGSGVTEIPSLKIAFSP